MDLFSFVWGEITLGLRYTYFHWEFRYICLIGYCPSIVTRVLLLLRITLGAIGCEVAYGIEYSNEHVWFYSYVVCLCCTLEGALIWCWWLSRNLGCSIWLWFLSYILGVYGLCIRSELMFARRMWLALVFPKKGVLQVVSRDACDKVMSAVLLGSFLVFASRLEVWFGIFPYIAIFFMSCVYTSI